MDLVIRGIAMLLFLITSTVRAAMTPADVETALDHWQPLIKEAAHRFAIPPLWIRNVMRLESAGQTFIDGKPTTSSAGAMGLMQVMPATYAELRERHDFGPDPYDPRDNIFAGAAYLRELYERYGWPSCSPPITPDRRASKHLSRPDDRCLRRRATTLRRWRPGVR
jgi:soluble lytic murein transglycosylase-like protein